MISEHHYHQQPLTGLVDLAGQNCGVSMMKFGACVDDLCATGITGFTIVIKTFGDYLTEG